MYLFLCCNVYVCVYVYIWLCACVFMCYFLFLFCFLVWNFVWSCHQCMHFKLNHMCAARITYSSNRFVVYVYAKSERNNEQESGGRAPLCRNVKCAINTKWHIKGACCGINLKKISSKNGSNGRKKYITSRNPKAQEEKKKKSARQEHVWMQQ